MTASVSPWVIEWSALVCSEQSLKVARWAYAVAVRPGEGCSIRMDSWSDLAIEVRWSKDAKAEDWQMKIARGDCILNPSGHVPYLRSHSRHNHWVGSEGTRQWLGPLKQGRNYHQDEGHSAVPSWYRRRKIRACCYRYGGQSERRQINSSVTSRSVHRFGGACSRGVPSFDAPPGVLLVTARVRRTFSNLRHPYREDCVGCQQYMKVLM